jgi:crossover junction endodeoxyribonuclease RuvC
MLVIGIDPGTATTGYGLVQEQQDGTLTVVDFGVILTAAHQPMAERLLELHHQLAGILLLHRPESGAVEKLFFARNVTTAISVGQARGVALMTLAQSGLGVAEYTPMEIKQAVAGYGGADKNQVQQMVRALLNLPEIPQPDDAADALAVAICHLHSAKTQALYDAQYGMDGERP